MPRALWALVARALSLAPDARFPSMDALLLQLDRAAAPPPRSRRGPILLLAGVAIAGLVAGVALRRQATAACRGPERALAAAWSPARKRDLRAAFLATRMPYAGAAFARIEASLDRYARDWTALHASTCEAAPERDSASQELFDLRLACLGDRLAGFAAQVEVLAAADSKTVELADRAARTLPTLADCADEAGLRAPVRPPADPAVRARVVEVRKQLGRARALEAAGRYPEGLAVASAAAAAAPVLGYRPLEGEALLTLGSLQSANGESKEAAATLRAAALAAEAGHADDVRAAALITLVEVTGEQLGHYDEAHAFGRQADVVLQRIDHGGQRAPLLATLARNEGIVWWRQGRYDRAIAALDQALALRTREFGPDDGRVAQTLSDIADTRSDQGQLEAALADYRRVLAIWSPTLGPEHPQVAVVLNNMANVLANQGKLDDALAQFQHALAIWTRALGPQHPKVGAVLNNIGDTYSRLRRYDEALDCYGRALPIFEAAYGPAHYTVGIAYVSRGETEQALGRLEAALVSYRRGLGILGKALGPTHPQLSIPLADIGDTLRLRGDLDGAMASYRRAQALFDKSPQSPELARVLVGVGLVLLAKHQPDAALAPLTRSVALLEAHPGDPVALADARFALARALWLQGRDRTAADAMAAATRDVYRQAGPRGQDQLNAVEKWLEDRR